MHLCINLFFSHCKFLGINAENGFVGLGDFLPRHRVIESTFPRSKIRLNRDFHYRSYTYVFCSEEWTDRLTKGLYLKVSGMLLKENKRVPGIYCSNFFLLKEIHFRR